MVESLYSVHALKNVRAEAPVQSELASTMCVPPKLMFSPILQEFCLILYVYPRCFLSPKLTSYMSSQFMLCSHDSHLSFKLCSLVSQIRLSSFQSQIHDTNAVHILGAAITAATVLVCVEKLHKLMKWVAPHRIINAPNCIRTHLQGNTADLFTKYMTSCGIEEYARAIRKSEAY